MASVRLIFVTFMTMITGVAVAFGLASFVGLFWHAAKIPTFLSVSFWWLWIGWRYACARDAANRRGVSRAEALSYFYQQYPREIVSEVQLSDTPPRGYYQHSLTRDCWFMQFSLRNDVPAHRSSRLVALSKRDGRIVYDGSADDEG